MARIRGRCVAPELSQKKRRNGAAFDPFALSVRSFGAQHRGVTERGGHIHLILPDPVERPACFRALAVEIGRAHGCTPVTNTHLACRLLLEKKDNTPDNTTLTRHITDHYSWQSH